MAFNILYSPQVTIVIVCIVCFKLTLHRKNIQRLEFTSVGRRSEDRRHMKRVFGKRIIVKGYKTYKKEELNYDKEKRRLSLPDMRQHR